jgi:rfaE bifunctional protein kinase chain/domain
VRELIARFRGRRVVVVGDVMVDHFQVGRVERISPEAPVPVVRFVREEYRLGGAANVAHNIAALGGRVRLVGLVGTDDAAGELRRSLERAGVDREGLVAEAGRPTTRKVRVVTERNQQVARVDYEADDDAAGAGETGLVAHLTAAARETDAIVLSDYAKGVVTPAVIAAAVAAARGAGVPLLVDPKVPQAERYRGATLITPNHHEAEVMTQMAIRSIEDARAAARRLRERTGANVLITWGEHGMWVLDAAREVADVTGAGDTVIGVLALGLAAGASLTDAARLANIAAGVVVAHFGPAAPTVDELQAAADAARAR